MSLDRLIIVEAFALGYLFGLGGIWLARWLGCL